ncbi:MAG: hypothetical protein AB1894_05625 [Chloroflexota bacterium]
MSVALATTWNPRGELGRFERLLPQLEQAYSGIAISFPPVADAEVVQLFLNGRLSGRPNLYVIQDQVWDRGRYKALELALRWPATHIHYADMDRLLRWVEVYPEEWSRMVQAIQNSDYLLMGRSPAAYATHPQSLVRTEAISNRVASYLVGWTFIGDVSAGSKGFSRRAVEFLLANTQPVRALGTDAEWTVLLQRAGFRLDYVELDGLDWESADRYRERAASPEEQRAAAQAIDTDAQRWAGRVEVALEIVEAALDAAHRPLEAGSKE